MKITVNPLDIKSINQAIKQIEVYRQEFEQKEQEFVRRLAEVGVSVATTGFQVADYDGENDVVVTMNQSGTQATVIASGATVGFIEFGTGVRYPEWSGDGSDYTPPKHGTYGKGKGASPHGWWFTATSGAGASQHTYGNMPAEAMLTARDRMIEQVVKIAREVWR